MPPEGVKTQRRGDVRRLKILAAGFEIIAEQGVDGLSMSDVSRRSKTPTGSLYQYYPNKQALVAAIAADKFEALHRCYEANFERCRNLDDFRRAAEKNLTTFVNSMSEQPGLLLLWSGITADKELRLIDEEDTRRNAGLVANVLAPLLPHMDDQELDRLSLLIVDVTGGVARTISARGEHKEELVKQCIEVLSIYLNAKAQAA